MNQILPSILAADFCNLSSEIKKMQHLNINWFHIDIMDGHFVDNLAIGMPTIISISKTFPDINLDCHLMVTNPKKWLNILISLKVKNITFHIEAVKNIDEAKEIIKTIKDNNIMCHCSVKPNTPIESILPIIDLIDGVLIMTVEPGFGGQKFMYNMIDKVKYLKEHTKINIQVDGGINNKNIEELYLAGANWFVMGSFLFKSQNLEQDYNTVNKLINK
jgi:ribulose-phosphate 3-epimerase